MLLKDKDCSEKKTDKFFSTPNRGWVKKKCTNGFKSGGNILGQSALKC